MKITDKIKTELRKASSNEKQQIFLKFFKTGKGQYGEGDLFIGVTVPEVRKVAKNYYKEISHVDCTDLLHSKAHEDRLCALIMMVYKYERSKEVEKEKIYKKYLTNIKYINNWDLVDLSCYKIVGEYLLTQNNYSKLLQLAKSADLWEKRIAVVSTFAFLKDKNPNPTLDIVDILLKDKHDLIHKAVGWMLREMGKRVGEDVLTEYLDKHACQMPRTALRYAIERLPEAKRQFYLKLK